MPAPSGSEPGYRRPVLVIQADAFNRSAIDAVVCAVITSYTGLAQAPGNVLLESSVSNLAKASVINVSQIVTLDKRYLTECAGALPARIMREVEAGIKLVLDLR